MEKIDHSDKYGKSWTKTRIGPDPVVYILLMVLVEQYKRAWSDIKRLVSNAPFLSFYKPHKELTLQCDASQNGLGAAVSQDEKPIYFD